jgi:hypothetical protein
MHRPRITYAELERVAHELDFRGLDLKSLIRALFDASCIGTVSEAPGRRPLYTFKYRNPTATIVPGQVMRIHPGALKALNIERGTGRPTARDQKARKSRYGRPRRPDQG